ncbi:MAG: hypothetical protein JXR96_25565 [Deltaproteobacteria bacterium]|nr:hypothetical protein [Deltaproteobacteria bacterium]
MAKKPKNALRFRSAGREVRAEPIELDRWSITADSGPGAEEVSAAQLGQTVVRRLDLSGEVPTARLPIEFESRRALGFIRRSTFPPDDWVWNFDVTCPTGSEKRRGIEESLPEAIERCAAACAEFEKD